MGSHEFGLHMTLDEEESTAAHQVPEMWAYLMAALHNGPLIKRGEGNWSVADFLGKPWAPPPPPAKPPTAASLKAFAGQAMGKKSKAKPKPKK